MDSLLEELEAFIRHDPAMRGLISSETKHGRLCAGHFAAAAKSLAEPNLRVAIVTGFFVPGANPPAAETDGPPGAVRLALALQGLGHHVTLMTDSRCAPALQVAAEVMQFPVGNIHIYPDAENEGSVSNVIRPPHPSPLPPGERGQDREGIIEKRAEIEGSFHEEFAGHLTHLISIERVGPSHSRESLRTKWGEGKMLERFLEQVSPEFWGHCHNMRGEIIDPWTGGLHRLFDWAAEHRPDMTTIGIGDGGNEIGMGCLKWDDIADRL